MAFTLMSHSHNYEQKRNQKHSKSRVRALLLNFLGMIYISLDGMGGYSKYDFRGREGGSRLKGMDSFTMCNSGEGKEVQG